MLSVMAPFVPALAWALALAVLFAPIQRWTETRLHRPNVSASVSVLIVALIVLVPALFVGERLLDEATNGASAIRSTIESGACQRAIEAHPALAPVGRWMWQQFDVQAAVASVTAWTLSTPSETETSRLARRIVDTVTRPSLGPLCVRRHTAPWAD